MDFSFRQECARKLIHLSSLWMPLSIWLFGSLIASLLMTLALIGVMIFELLRRKDHAFGIFLQRFFAPVLRPFETSPTPLMTGAAYMLIGAVLTTAIFPPDIAIAALTVLMISDTCAALIGRSYGRHALFGKSLEGTLAFLFSAIMIVSGVGFLKIHAYETFLVSGCAAAIAATFVELFAPRLKVDDNIGIPISFAITQTLMLALL